MDWHYCPMCAEPVTIKPNEDIGCVLGCIAGVGLVIVGLFVASLFIA